ncbi:M3 family oligoendopeptidase [Qipengyuania sphaerica]|uniref:M3 family oligoendopeptidase n=1 Tax=Qipengyuania sphaerica TaxID=2867243 RepID=UPI001C87D026|nr:M3 family oligoendopeptidase [Qipengyuania sphaerica]MBX7541320.1 oligoendopeptidase F family protein [Qipengyuania sphaerica]
MLQTDRRGALAIAASLPIAGAVPAFAQVGESISTGAWDLSEIFSDWAAWDAARQDVLDALPRLTAYQGTLGSSSSSMAKVFGEISDIRKAASRVYSFSKMISDEDVRIAENQERLGQSSEMYTAFGAAISWVLPEVLELGEEKVEAFIAEDETLRTRFALDLRETLRGAEHVLDEKGESLLALASGPLTGPGDVRGQLVASDIPRPTVTLSDGRELKLDDQGAQAARYFPNRDDRKLVFDKYFSSYGEFSNSLGAAYASRIKGNIFRAKARNYPNTLAASLDGPNIPESVYRNLVSETNKGLPELHRYFDLRRRILGLPDIGYYDIYPPLVTLDRKFSLDQMRAITIDSLKPFGREYVDLLVDATGRKWMDPFPRPGKYSGAYMNGNLYDLHPYLLLNLEDDYSSLSTYTHEWGHAIHTLLAKANNPYETYRYSTFTAEIASTVNQVFLSRYMLERAQSKEEKLFYLGMQMEDARSVFFRQVQFAEFELRSHEMGEKGEGMSGRKFAETYHDILRRYHGPDMILPDYIAHEWSMVPHFFGSPYYVYQYATSISAGNWFAKSILDGGEKEREAFLGVLRAGGSDYPVEILKKAGLDMTKPDVYRDYIADFSATMDKIEALL